MTRTSRVMRTLFRQTPAVRSADGSPQPTLHDQAGKLADRTQKLSDYAGTLREHASGRSLAYVGAGLALAGTGAAAAAGGFAGPAARPGGQADSINRATAPVSASQHPGRPEAASHQVKHALSQHTEATKPAVHVTGKPQPADSKASNAAHRTAADHVSTHQQSAHRMTFRWTRGGGHPKAWDAIERFAMRPAGVAPEPRPGARPETGSPPSAPPARSPGCP